MNPIINKLFKSNRPVATPPPVVVNEEPTLESRFQERLLQNKEDARRVNNYLLEAKSSFDRRYNNRQLSSETIDKYERSRTLGAGSFGTVVLVRNRTSNNFFAMKIMSKKSLVKSKHISHILEEKKILYSINFNLLIKLHSHHQDNSFIYLITDFINGGEMFTHLRKVRRFNESKARFYASQVVLAFEYLHFMDVIYRDLKPENILIHKSGYIKIIDMGFAKHAKGIVWTLCGTPEYIAPEILMNRGYNRAIDWYTLGILLYEMVAGFTPYYAPETTEIYKKVIEARLRFPNGFSLDLKDLIRRLLSKDVTQRYGNLKDGVNDIKDHRWFMETDWMSMFRQEVPAPYIPEVLNDGDTSNFEQVEAEPMIVAQENAFGDAFHDW